MEKIDIMTKKILLDCDKQVKGDDIYEKSMERTNG